MSGQVRATSLSPGLVARSIAAGQLAPSEIRANGTTAGATASSRDFEQRVRCDERSEVRKAHPRGRGPHSSYTDALGAVFDRDARRCARPPVGCVVTKPGARHSGTSLRGESSPGNARGDAPVPAEASSRNHCTNSAGRAAQCASCSSRLSVQSSSATSPPAVHALPSSSEKSWCFARLSACRSLFNPSPWSFRAASMASTSSPQESRQRHQRASR